jgi:hypothetical protein
MSGYNIYFKSYAANPSIVNPTPSYFMVLNYSQADNKFFISDTGVDTFEIIYNPVSQLSTFKLTVLDRYLPNNVDIL